MNTVLTHREASQKCLRLSPLLIQLLKGVRRGASFDQRILIFFSTEVSLLAHLLATEHSCVLVTTLPASHSETHILSPSSDETIKLNLFKFKLMMGIL